MSADGHFRAKGLEDRLGLDAVGAPVHADHIEGRSVTAPAIHKPLCSPEMPGTTWTEHWGGERAVGKQTCRVATAARYLHECEYKDI